MKKSSIYKFNGKAFRYNFDHAEVEYLSKATKEEFADNEEWQAKHGKNLWDIDNDGYILIHSIGLSIENWKNKECRNEYLEEWIAEMDAETSYLSDSFVKYELKYYL